jgi:hypothetical protein
LKPQIERNVEAYIDDVIIKLKKCGDLLDDLKEIFDNLRKYKMVFNPKICVLGVSLGKFLDYMVSSQGINVNPKRWKPSNNGNHLRPEKESRSWQA